MAAASPRESFGLGLLGCGLSDRQRTRLHPPPPPRGCALWKAGPPGADTPGIRVLRLRGAGGQTRASQPVAPALQLPNCVSLPITSLPSTGQVVESGTQTLLVSWTALDMAWLEALPYVCGWLILRSCLLVRAQVRTGVLAMQASLQHLTVLSPASFLGGRSRAPGVLPVFGIGECTAGKGRTLFFHGIPGIFVLTTSVVSVCW